MDGSIYEWKNYGIISITLREMLDNRNITRNKLSKLTGIPYKTIDGYYKFDASPITSVDLNVLAKICYVLQCEIGDILKYEKP